MNFANWEITELLPNQNPYLKEVGESMYYCWVKRATGGKTIDTECSLRFYFTGEILRDAWTWEDIRLYLQDKGFVLEVLYVDDFLKSLKKAHDPDKEYLDWHYRYRETKNMDNFHSSSNTYSTYEEAREVGVLEVLSLIKQNTK